MTVSVEKGISKISVAVCTYKRPILLQKCLASLLVQTTSNLYEIIVVDNDADGSAMEIVNFYQPQAIHRGIRLLYVIEPEQNIALARNKAIANCKGEYIAFIDDDEYASPDWLEKLYYALLKYNADAVFGPVFPVFPDFFPDWMKNSLLFKRNNISTGQKIVGTTAATNNALIKSTILKSRTGPFDCTFGRIGGEDTDLFSWLYKQNCIFIWCNEAIVYEIQEDNRCFLKWHIRRGYRGGWGYAYRTFREYKPIKAISLILLKVIGGTLKASFKSLSYFHNPKAAFFFFLKEFSGQIGKIGYILGFKIEEYKTRK